MNMKKIVSLTAMIAGTLLFVACGDENTTVVNEMAGIEVVDSGDALPTCNSENAGQMLLVSDSNAVY